MVPELTLFSLHFAAITEMRGNPITKKFNQALYHICPSLVKKIYFRGNYSTPMFTYDDSLYIFMIT